MTFLSGAGHNEERCIVLEELAEQRCLRREQLHQGEHRQLKYKPSKNFNVMGYSKDARSVVATMLSPAQTTFPITLASFPKSSCRCHV